MGVAVMTVPDLACSLIERSLGFLINNAGLLKSFHGVIKQPLVEISSLLGVTCTPYMQGSTMQDFHTIHGACNVGFKGNGEKPVLVADM